jgi:transposase-like protein
MPKTHPTYDSGFRQEAVNLLISSRRPLKTVAAELGVSANSLRTWRDRAFHHGLDAQAASARGRGPKGRSVEPLVEPAAEIRRLQRENEYLRRQREILKKAMSILSEAPQSGMP